MMANYDDVDAHHIEDKFRWVLVWLVVLLCLSVHAPSELLFFLLFYHQSCGVPVGPGEFIIEQGNMISLNEQEVARGSVTFLPQGRK